jgi:hypothetical protein
MGAQSATPLSMPPLQFAPPPPLSPDATGVSALGGLTNLALATQKRASQPPSSKAVDAPMRRKTPMVQAMGAEPNYA